MVEEGAVIVTTVFAVDEVVGIVVDAIKIQRLNDEWMRTFNNDSSKTLPKQIFRYFKCVRQQ